MYVLIHYDSAPRKQVVWNKKSRKARGTTLRGSATTFPGFRVFVFKSVGQFPVVFAVSLEYACSYLKLVLKNMGAREGKSMREL